MEQLPQIDDEERSEDGYVKLANVERKRMRHEDRLREEKW